jgi:hypothetical protein
MGWLNTIWQRDANSVVLRSLEHASAPPFLLNLTGPETISVRDAAQRMGQLAGRNTTVVGAEAPTALLSNASRCTQLFGPPTVSAERLIDWTASWVMTGGRSLGKPTHFEARDGKF